VPQSLLSVSSCIFASPIVLSRLAQKVYCCEGEDAIVSGALQTHRHIARVALEDRMSMWILPYRINGLSRVDALFLFIKCSTVVFITLCSLKSSLAIVSASNGAFPFDNTGAEILSRASQSTLSVSFESCYVPRLLRYG
jgi:hypothetical protein